MAVPPQALAAANIDRCVEQLLSILRAHKHLLRMFDGVPAGAYQDRADLYGLRAARLRTVSEASLGGALRAWRRWGRWCGARSPPAAQLPAEAWRVQLFLAAVGRGVGVKRSSAGGG